MPSDTDDNSIDMLEVVTAIFPLEANAWYWMTKIANSIKNSTKFKHHLNFHQLRLMPFERLAAPDSFQRILNEIVSSSKWLVASVYRDVVTLLHVAPLHHLEYIQKVLLFQHSNGAILENRKNLFFFDNFDYFDCTIHTKQLKQAS